MDLASRLAGIAPAFTYENGQLHASGVNLAEIAAAAGGPVYVYDLDAILRGYREFKNAFEGQPTRICYAMKANDSIGVIKALAAEGAGLDVVSGGELALALAAGVPADRIVFSGVGKTDAELNQAIDAGVMQINVETPYELERLSVLASAKGAQASIAFRVNPNIEAGTLEQISTGRAKDKFGVAFEDAEALYTRAASLPGIRLTGIAMHIGSQIADLSHCAAACAKLRELWDRMAAIGITLKRFDIGGGLGIRYKDETPPSVQAYADTVKAAVADIDCEVVLEPGRRIVGPAGVLVSEVISIKQSRDRRFVILNAAMNDLIRPALYQAWHEIVPLTDPGAAEWTPADIVGPVCESTDKFAEARNMPELKAGDLVAFLSAGAYCSVMACEYNSRLRAPEAIVQNGQWSFSRPPRTYADIIAEQTTPDWL